MVKGLQTNFSTTTTRINVVGSSGSGKTAFARALGATLGIRHVAMDELFWGPNWQPRPDGDFLHDLQTIVASDRWVLDGNYSRTIPIKWPRTQAVIWLDFSFALTTWRSIKRATRRAWTKEELWPGTGNRETFRKSFFSKDSIIWWSVSNFEKVRRKYERHLDSDEYPHLTFVRLRSPVDAKRLLATLSAEARHGATETA